MFNALRRSWLAVAMLALLPFAFALAACGDDDDSGGATPKAGSSATTAPEKTSPAAAAATPAGGGAAPTAADLAYVKDVCKANSAAVNSATSALTSDPAILTDSAKLNKALSPVIQTHLDALEKAKPPADYEAGHAAFVKQDKDLLAKLKANQVTNVLDLANLGNKDVTVPKATLDRLKAAAKATPDCAAVDADFFGKAG